METRRKELSLLNYFLDKFVARIILHCPKFIHFFLPGKVTEDEVRQQLLNTFEHCKKKGEVTYAVSNL